MKYRAKACFAVAVAVLSWPGHAAEVELALPTVQIESPEASLRAFSIGFARGSTLSAGFSTDGGPARFGSSSGTEVRVEFAPGERLVLGVVAADEEVGDGGWAEYTAGRAKLVLRSAEETPGAWDTAITVSAGRSSYYRYSESANVGVESTLNGSTTTVALVFGRHRGDGRSVLFGGPFHTSARYSGRFQRWTETVGDYVEPGCALFFCWGGYYQTEIRTETTQVSGNASATGVALGVARRWSRVRLGAQLALAQVDAGAGGDTVALFTAGGDFFLGRPHQGGD